MSKNVESVHVQYLMKSVMTDLKDAVRNSDKSLDDIAFSAGVSTNQLHRYFDGKAVIPFDRLIAIADELGIDMAFILGDESKKCFISSAGKESDLQVELKNLRFQIEREKGCYSIEDKLQYIHTLSEMEYLLSDKPC